MTSLKDVAKKAGVSTATVSRVVNDDGHVKQTTKEKVQQAMAELSYRPNSAARRLAGGKSHVIGLMISDYKGLVFSQFLDELENNLRSFNRHMVVSSGRANLKIERDSIHFLKSSDVDGLILYSEVLPDSELIEISKQIPTAILNRNISAISNQCIWQDNAMGMEQILAHIHAQNFKDVAFITGPMSKPDGIERKASALHMARQYNMNIHAVIEGEFTISSGYSAMKQILEDAEKAKSIEAVICANDESALGALKALNEAELSCPYDFALTGYDNIPSLEAASTNITTAELPIKAMCKEVTNLIMNLTYGHDHPIQHRFTPKLITRRSSMNIR